MTKKRAVAIAILLVMVMVICGACKYEVDLNWPVSCHGIDDDYICQTAR